MKIELELISTKRCVFTIRRYMWLQICEVIIINFFALGELFVVYGTKLWLEFDC